MSWTVEYGKLDDAVLALVLSCAAPVPTPKTEARINETLHQEIDWPQLIAFSLHHGMGALLFLGLRSSPHTPPEVLQTLRQHVHVNALRCKMLFKELVEVLALFEQENIPAIPLKGLSLAQAAYGDITLRPPGDLDFLLRKEDIPRARVLLMKRDYTPHIPIDQEAAYLETQLGYEFGGRGFVIELHWAFLPQTLGFRLNPEEAWQKAETVSMAEHSIKALTLEDRLLFLCAHGGKHGWDRLKWSRDIAGLIEHHRDTDWAQVVERAKSLHSERILYLGCYLAQELFGTQVPEVIGQHIEKDPQIPRLAQQVREQFIFEDEEHADKRQRALFHLQLRERLRDRWPYFAHLMRLASKTTKKDRASLSLPPTLQFLYPVIRPFRVLGNYGADAGRYLWRMLSNTFLSR